LTRLWSRPLSIVILLCGLALLMWALFGRVTALAILAGTLLLLVLHHIYNLSLLHDWLREPRPESVPNGAGAWVTIFAYLLRLLKRQRASEFSLSKALERFELAGEAFPEAVVLLDDNEQIVWCNPLAEAYFGLNLKRDTHFTSPIRRYADLIVHRALIAALKLGEGGLPADTAADLPEIAAHISAAERRAMAAERETTDRLIANHLSEQVGTSFQGRISGVTRSGLFVKLAESGADGFIPVSTLGLERFHYDESQHALVAGRSGETYQIGDNVEVKLVEARPMAGALRFEMLSHGRKGRPPRVSAGRGKKPPFRGPRKSPNARKVRR